MASLKYISSFIFYISVGILYYYFNNIEDFCSTVTTPTTQVCLNDDKRKLILNITYFLVFYFPIFVLILFSVQNKYKTAFKLINSFIIIGIFSYNLHLIYHYVDKVEKQCNCTGNDFNTYVKFYNYILMLCFFLYVISLGSMIRSGKKALK